MKKKTGKAPNRKYKDSVFIDLFRDKNNLLDLYQNVLHPEDTETKIEDLEIITIDNILVSGQYNDLAFRIKDRLIILVEHQSSINPNMPYRMLLYVAEEYSRLIQNSSIVYSSRKMSIPAPEFYVVYTGDKRWEQEVLKLSDLFSSNYNKKASIELNVQIIKQEEMKGILEEYHKFMEVIHENVQKYGKTVKAIQTAIEETSRMGILSKYLNRKEREVRDMLKEEFSLEDYIAVREKDSWEEGREEGREEGMRKGQKLLIMKALEKRKSFEDVADLFGMSVEEIKNIVKGKE